MTYSFHLLALSTLALLTACGGSGEPDPPSALGQPVPAAAPALVLTAAAEPQETSDATEQAPTESGSAASPNVSQGMAPSAAPAMVRMAAAVSPAQVTGQRWSDPKTWGGTVPPAGANVVVPVGKTIVLDVQTPALKGLTVQGALVAAPDADIGITSDYIMVRGGQLRIGSAQAPHTRRATITLTGNTTADLAGSMGFGAKVLGVMGGRLELHGKPSVTNWTALGADVAVGAKTITLARAPGWSAGDEIVIATSSTNQNHYDVATIQSISGATLTLATALKYKHLGAIRTVGTTKVDVRAEVGRLNRNIVVQGDAGSVASKIGGHAMFMAGGPTTVQIANAEFRRMGQHNQLGRYPLHFHLMENGCKDCYVKDSSVRDTIQRGIVVHGTSGVTVAGNVVFNTVGHNIFIEDEKTTGNLIERNLALVNKQPNPLHTEPTLVSQNDRMPANFWFRSGRNTVTNNAAGGSFANGYIYDNIPTPSDGPITFLRNTAHAAMGTEGTGAGDFDTMAGLMILGGGHIQDRIEDTLVYHNRIGIWPEEGGPYKFERFVAAENVEKATENRGVTTFTTTYKDGVFIASLDGKKPSTNELHIQYGGEVHLINPIIANWGDGRVLSVTDPVSTNTTFFSVTNPTFVGKRPTEVGMAGDEGMYWFADNNWVPKGFYVDATQKAAWAPDCRAAGRLSEEESALVVCPQRYAYAELDVRDRARPNALLSRTTPIQRSDGLRFTQGRRGGAATSDGTFGYFVIYNAGLSYSVTQPSAQGYALRLNGNMFDSADVETNPIDDLTARLDVTVAVSSCPTSVHRLPVPNGQLTGSVSGASDSPGQPTPASRITPLSSLSELATRALDGYFCDAAAKKVHLKANRQWVHIVP